MAKGFQTDIDLNGNEVQNMALEKLASAPGSPVLGRTYFNTTTGEAEYWNGIEWIKLIPGITGDNNVTNNYNTQKIDTSIAVGNYGTLGGTVDGTNDDFTVSQGVYATGTLQVFINGKQTFDFSETTPASGTFALTDAPEATDWVMTKYLTVETSADTLFDPTKIYFQTMQQLIDAYALYGGTVVYSPIGMIDAGALELELGPDSLVIVGNSYFVSGIFSTEDSHTMFKTEAATYSGNIFMNKISLYSSGVGSKLFDLDNDENSGAIEFMSCNIGDFAGTTTELGELANYRQFRTSDCGFFRVQDGLTFTGTWSGGFRIGDTIVLAQAASSTLFKPGVGLTFNGRCISDINAASADNTTTQFGFIEANFTNDGSFQLNGAAFPPDTATSVVLDEDSTKAFFRDCVEIRNTRAGFVMEWTSQVNTPLTVDTPAKALGATVISQDTWFNQTANNEITYVSTLVKDLIVTVNVTIDGGPNDDIAVHIRRWDDSASAYVVEKTKVRNISNVVGGLDVTTFNFTTWILDLAENDRIELWIENKDDNTNAAVTVGSEIFGEVR